MSGESRPVRMIRQGLTAAAALANPLTWSAVGSPRAAGTRDEVCRGAVDWLLRANAEVPDGNGFSLGYFLDAGWQPAYVETSGYLLPTLFRLTRHSDYRRDEVLAAARRSAAWLRNVQFRDGSFGNPTHYRPTVFDTGQVVFGLLAAARHLDDSSYLDAAVRAGDWLCAVQDADGAWRQFAYGGVPHTYYTEVAWALLVLWERTGEARYRASAGRNIEWALGRRHANGFFRDSGFVPDRPAVLHTIAYTIQGMLEAGMRLQSPDAIGAAVRACRALQEDHRRNGVLRGEYDENWRPAASYLCLTGLAQMGVVWTRLSRTHGDGSFEADAKSTYDYLATRQLRACRAGALRGGLPGSDPLWGRYFRFRLPNWGLKFLLDLWLFDPAGPRFRPVDATR